MNSGRLRAILMMGVVIGGMATAWGGADIPTKFTNQNSIINTRHNLTMRSATGTELFNAGIMDGSRNNYLQVCVYCHTPHGANATAAAPLWNRAIPATNYTTYNQLGTSVGETYAQPGGASLSCLSCHDGQQAVDAIMNMPGSGGYSATPDNAFLTTWYSFSGGKSAYTDVHLGLNGANPDSGCLACHQPGSWGALFGQATDFTVFAIGTDLRNDHPIGVTYPTTNGSGTDWNTPGGSKVVGGQTIKFFDEIANGRLDKNEIRLYAGANGPSVECATCHDPHGVPSGGAGSTFNPSFLRKPIVGSSLCLTCHAK